MPGFMFLNGPNSTNQILFGGVSIPTHFVCKHCEKTLKVEGTVIFPCQCEKSLQEYSFRPEPTPAPVIDWRELRESRKVPLRK